MGPPGPLVCRTEDLLSHSSYLFTSESVSEGHPDKVCDRISDTIVDLFLAADPASRVACETLATTHRIVLAGEVRGPRRVTHELMAEKVRAAVRDIGYEQDAFHCQNCGLTILLKEQLTAKERRDVGRGGGGKDD